MFNKKFEFVDFILDKNKTIPTVTKSKTDYHFSPINIALVKYWGKRNNELHLPYNSSISYTMQNFGTKTKLELSQNDSLVINNALFTETQLEYKKVFDFINLFRKDNQQKISVTSINNIPIKAGLASSASAFSSLIIAINDFFNLGLTIPELSVLSRIGSGSACRSFYDKFTIWHKGNSDIDSIVEPILSDLEIVCGIIPISLSEKKVSSRECMEKTVTSSPLYKYWPEIAEEHAMEMKSAIINNDFATIGKIAELNATLMHTTIAMIADDSRLDYQYLTTESLKTMKAIQDIRDQQGIEVYYTIDAGSNIKIISQKKDITKLKGLFHGLILDYNQ